MAEQLLLLTSRA